MHRIRSVTANLGQQARGKYLQRRAQHSAYSTAKPKEIHHYEQAGSQHHHHHHHQAQRRRGGRNLSDRYAQLGRSLRVKEARMQEVADLEKTVASGGAQAASLVDQGVAPAGKEPGTAATATGFASSSTPPVKTFRGLAIPRKPEPPADDECCMSGCAVCVYDLYDESVAAYEESISQLRKTLEAMAIPMDEWPTDIRPSSSRAASTTQAPSKSPTLSAFEELERKLSAKAAESSDANSSNPQAPSSIPVPSPASSPPPLLPSRTRFSSTTRPRGTSETEKVTWRNIIEGLRWLVFSNR